MRCEFESAKIGTVEASGLLRDGGEARCQCDVMDVDVGAGNHIPLSFGVSMACWMVVSRCRLS